MTTLYAGAEKIVESHVRISVGDVALVRQQFSAPIDTVGYGDDHHLQLSMMPTQKKAKACYLEQWGPNRFETMGDLFMLPARLRLRARSECRVQHAIICRFKPDLVAALFQTNIEWTEQRLVGSLDIASDNIRRLLYRIAGELHSPGFASDAMIESLVAQACVELARYFQNVEINLPSGGLPPRRLRLINDCLANDPGGTTLSGLANLCGLSVRHLTRAFRASCGQSLGDYIAHYRIDHARRMLAAGASVKEAAFAVGFTASTNFSAAFRRATGYTPRQYRELVRQTTADSKSGH